eukprot:COSAG06_NODE_49588_length_324_cov_0.920000_1_plen_60_part_01
MVLGLLAILAALILGVGRPPPPSILGGKGKDEALVLALVGVFLCTCGGKMVFNASNPHKR